MQSAPFAGTFAPFIVISLGFWPTVGAGVLAAYPLGRRADRARTVLKKWTELKAEGVLGAQVHASDPRIDVAARMVERILSHPSTPPEAKGIVTRTETHLASAVADLSTIGVRRRLEGPDAQTSDVEAKLELRVARLLSALGELHQSVVARDRSFPRCASMRHLSWTSARPMLRSRSRSSVWPVRTVSEIALHDLTR